LQHLFIIAVVSKINFPYFSLSGVSRISVLPTKKFRNLMVLENIGLKTAIGIKANFLLEPWRPLNNYPWQKKKGKS
jgi:hypothetical protein